MARVVTSSADPKIAYFVGVSPSMTEITLGRQTMMGSMSGGRLLTGGAVVHGAEEPMVTKIHTNVALGGGGAGTGLLDKDMGRRGGYPLSFSDLDTDGVIAHWGRSR